MKSKILLALRIVAAVAIFVPGLFVIYMFGAGYFSGWGIWLPTPLNIVGTVVLLGALLALCVWLVRGTLRGDADLKS